MKTSRKKHQKDNKLARKFKFQRINKSNNETVKRGRSSLIRDGKFRE
jgi:hypothetical protein